MITIEIMMITMVDMMIMMMIKIILKSSSPSSQTAHLMSNFNNKNTIH
jgi:hypothetical protein